MGIRKDIEIDGQMVAFKASAAIPRIYRLKFQRDIYKDLAVLEKSIGDGKEESSNLDMFSLEMFENIAFIMAKHADPSIPDTPEEWLDTNIRAHNFISKQYWQNNFNIVKEMLSQSEIYVYEEKSEIQGFVGLSDKHIEGIFVSSKVQSKGIGNLLITGDTHRNFSRIEEFCEENEISIVPKRKRSERHYLYRPFACRQR